MRGWFLKVRENAINGERRVVDGNPSKIARLSPYLLGY